nr:MAG TPA: hypothetical protein [Caudoviricetes sp.]
MYAHVFIFMFVDILAMRMYIESFRYRLLCV